MCQTTPQILIKVLCSQKEGGIITFIFRPLRILNLALSPVGGLDPKDCNSRQVFLQEPVGQGLQGKVCAVCLTGR